MRSSWLYLAVRSLRATEPVLIWPAFTAGAIRAVVLGELAGRDVQRQRDVVAGRVAGALDGLHEEVEGGGVAAERRREAALVAQPRAELLFLQGLLERVEDLDGHAERVAERVGARRHQR